MVCLVQLLICYAVVFLAQFSSGWDYQNRFQYTTMGRSREEIKSPENQKRHTKSRMSPLEIPLPLQTHHTMEKVDLVSTFTGNSLELVHSTFPQASSQQPSNLEYLEAPHSPPSHLQRSHQSLSPVWNEAFGLLRSSSWHSYFGCTSCQHSYVKCGLDISTHVINFHLYIINQSGCIHAMHTHQIYPREVFNTFGKFLYKEFMLCVRLCLHLF